MVSSKLKVAATVLSGRKYKKFLTFFENINKNKGQFLFSTSGPRPKIGEIFVKL